MGTQTMELAPEEIVTSSSPSASPEDEAAPARVAPGSADADDVVLPRGRRSRLSLLATFLPVATAGVALAAHQIVPNHQNATSTGVYARVLVGVMIAFTLLGLTQRFWRRMRPTRWNFPIAAVFNLLRWLVSSAPIVGVGILLLCGWELITLKLNLLPLPYFPGPDGVLRTLVEDWRSAGLGQPGLAQCMLQSLILLLGGYLAGSVIGIVCGVLIGWFAPARYWGMPVMKLIGPIPATALIPMA